MKTMRNVVYILMVVLALAGARPASAATSALITLSGIKFNDLNGDGAYQDCGGQASKPNACTPEPLLQGWTIYLDLNNDGRFDPGEPSAITDAAGAFTITTSVILDPNNATYTLREIGQPNWVQTVAPAPLVFPPTSYTGLQFGNRFTPSPAEVPESDTLWLFGAGGVAMALYLLYRRRTQPVQTL